MTQQTLTETLAAMAAPLAQSLGLVLWGIEISFGTRGIVRIFVESGTPVEAEAESAPDSAVSQGVSIDQCASLSRLLSLSLDVEDVMPGAYVLEVSSPGLERTFFTAAQLAGAVGQTVSVTFNQAPEGQAGRRKFRGVLDVAPPEAADGPDALFSMIPEDEDAGSEQGARLSFTFAELKKARLVHVMPDKGKPGKGGKKKAAPAQAAGSGAAEVS